MRLMSLISLLISFRDKTMSLELKRISDQIVDNNLKMSERKRYYFEEAFTHEKERWELLIF